jgi:hypothetical protein
MAGYSHRRLYDLAGAVEKLPSFLPQSGPADRLAATGTDGKSSTPEVVSLRSACESLRSACVSDESRCDSVRTNENPPMGMRKEVEERNSLKEERLQAIEGDCVRLRGISPAGLEPATFSSGDGSGADPSTLPAMTCGEPRPSVAHQLPTEAQIDPELQRVLEAWPHLPPHIRAGMLALVEAIPSTGKP